MASPNSNAIISGGATVPEELQSTFLSEDYAAFVLDASKTQIAQDDPALALARKPQMIEMPGPWSVRDQLKRGTCTAFAVTSCVEVLEAMETGSIRRFSPEHLYWNMRDGRTAADLGDETFFNLGATKIEWAVEALKDKGICAEGFLPYVTDKTKLRDGLFLKDPPSKEADQNAAKFKYISDDATDFKDSPVSADVPSKIRAALSENRPVAIGLPIFDFKDFAATNWTSPSALSTGIVRLPPRMSTLKKEDKVSSHAVCIVGYQPSQKSGGSGWFIFKNSWDGFFGRNAGPGFGANPDIPRIGYGAISEDYVRGYTIEFASFRKSYHSDALLS